MRSVPAGSFGGPRGGKRPYATAAPAQRSANSTAWSENQLMSSGAPPRRGPLQSQRRESPGAGDYVSQAADEGAVGRRSSQGRDEGSQRKDAGSADSGLSARLRTPRCGVQRGPGAQLMPPGPPEPV